MMTSPQDTSPGWAYRLIEDAFGEIAPDIFDRVIPDNARVLTKTKFCLLIKIEGLRAGMSNRDAGLWAKQSFDDYEATVAEFGDTEFDWSAGAAREIAREFMRDD